MKILIDAQVFQSPSAFRGMGRYSLELTKALLRKSRGHEFVFSVNRGLRDKLPGAIAQIRAIDPTARFFSFETIPTDWPVTQAQRNAVALVQYAHVSAIAPDILHSHSFFEPEAVGLQTADACVPVDAYRRSAILYDLIPALFPQQYLEHAGPADHYWRKYEGLSHCDSLLAISEASRQDGIERLKLPSDAIHNIGAAAYGQFKKIDLSADERSALNGRYGISRPFIMYTSGPDYRKNNERLIEAFSVLPPQLRRRYQLVIVMDLANLTHREDYTALARKLDLSDDELVLTGFVPDDDLLKLYNACELFIFPSLYEGFGLPILEALHCGAAVLVGNNSSQIEIVTNPAAHFDASSVRDIADKLTYTLSNKNFRTALKAQAQERVKLFTWESVASRALDAWEECAKRARFHSVAPVSETIKGLAQADRLVECTPSVLVRAAASRPSGKPRLLIDVTYIDIIDRKSGIQRVVRNVCRELLTAEDNYEILLVAAGEDRILRSANRLAREWQFTTNWPDVVRIQENDVLLMLDSSWEFFDRFDHTFQQIQENFGRIVTVVYDTIPLDFPELCDQGFINVLTSWLEKAAAVSDALLCISRDVAKRVSFRITEKSWQHRSPQIGYFHLGADIESEVVQTQVNNEQTETLPQFADDAPLFLVVSTIEPRKGQDVILDAFDRVWSSGIEAQLCFVGKQGWHVEQFVERIRNHPRFGSRLHWLSNVDDTDLAKCYARSKALLFASKAEGYGLGVVEAARYGVQVLCSDIDVFRETANDGAFFVAQADAQAWADAIARIARGEKLSAPEKILAITWKQSAQQIIDFLDDPMGAQNVTALTESEFSSQSQKNMKSTSIIAASMALAACSSGHVSIPADAIPTSCLTKSGVGSGRDATKALNDGEFVAIAYQTILQRPADAAGLKHHCDLLTSGKTDRRGLILAMSQLPEAIALTRK